MKKSEFWLNVFAVLSAVVIILGVTYQYASPETAENLRTVGLWLTPAPALCMLLSIYHLIKNEK